MDYTYTTQRFQLDEVEMFENILPQSEIDHHKKYARYSHTGHWIPIKTMAIAVLQDKATGRFVITGSVHFSSGAGSDEKYLYSKAIKTIIQEFQAIYPNAVIVFGGDFNQISAWGDYNFLIGDVMEELGCDKKGAFAIHDGKDWGQVDNIFGTDSGLTSVSNKRIVGGLSDHYLCGITLEWE